MDSQSWGGVGRHLNTKNVPYMACFLCLSAVDGVGWPQAWGEKLANMKMRPSLMGTLSCLPEGRGGRQPSSKNVPKCPGHVFRVGVQWSGWRGCKSGVKSWQTRKTHSMMGRVCCVCQRGRVGSSRTQKMCNMCMFFKFECNGRGWAG